MAEILEVNGLDGKTRWYKDGVPHRDGGPAIIGKDGYEAWIKNGEPHREDGPAIIHPGNIVSWWYEGNRVNLDEIDPSHPLYNRMLVYYTLTT